MPHVSEVQHPIALHLFQHQHFRVCLFYINYIFAIINKSFIFNFNYSYVHIAYYTFTIIYLLHYI